MAPLRPLVLVTKNQVFNENLLTYKFIILKIKSNSNCLKIQQIPPLAKTIRKHVNYGKNIGMKTLAFYRRRVFEKGRKTCRSCSYWYAGKCHAGFPAEGVPPGNLYFTKYYGITHIQILSILLENLSGAQLTVTKISTISLYLTKLYVTQSFAIASSVTYSEIRQNLSDSVQARVQSLSRIS